MTTDNAPSIGDDRRETLVIPLDVPPDDDLATELLVTLSTELHLDVESRPPLDAVVDTDLLDSLGTPSASQGPYLGTVSFEYAGYRIVVQRTGDAARDEPNLLVTVREADGRLDA